MRRALAAAALAAGGLAAHGARAEVWHLGFGAERGTPGGYVQVRENAIQGTPLGLRSDLGIAHADTLDLTAARRLGANGALHLALAATDLPGSGELRQPAYFNGTKLAPGPISSETGYTDFWGLQAGYWRRVATFGGGSLWLGAGLTFVSLNFRIGARVAADSVGHETKEDFNTQELPVPLFGIHLRYPIGHGLSLFAGFSGGHLPWTNSLRREGGMVQVTQTDQDARLGLRYRFGPGWTVAGYLYDRIYEQNERSGEDGNFVRIDQHGIGVRVGRGF